MRDIPRGALILAYKDLELVHNGGEAMEGIPRAKIYGHRES